MEDWLYGNAGANIFTNLSFQYRFLDSFFIPPNESFKMENNVLKNC